MQQAFLTDNYNKLLQFGPMSLEIRLTQRKCATFRLTKFGWFGMTNDGHSLCSGWEKVATELQHELELNTVEARLCWGEYLVAPYLDHHRTGGSEAIEPQVKAALEAVFRLADVVRCDPDAAVFAHHMNAGLKCSRTQ